VIYVYREREGEREAIQKSNLCGYDYYNYKKQVSWGIVKNLKNIRCLHAGPHLYMGHAQGPPSHVAVVYSYQSIMNIFLFVI